MAIVVIAGVPASPESAPASIKVSFSERLGPLHIDRMGLGQGGLSDEPMWDNRAAEIRVLHPGLVRLFVQEYFNLLPKPGQYQFETLDRSVDTILKTGAKPLMCICFKPRALFPKIDQDVVEPNDYAEWECLVGNLVKHYRERRAGIRYWEIANEPDIGEFGGCPYRFQPETYISYYRHTTSAILRADPEAQVGSPALANVRSPILPAFLKACEKEKIPAHFASWHIYSSDPARVRSTIDYVKKLIQGHPGLKLQTVLDEWNMDLTNPPLDPRFQPCYVLETIWQMKEAGLDWSCYYHIRDYYVRHEQFAPFFSPAGAAFMTRWWNRMPQFDGLFDFQDTVRPTYFALKLLARLTGDRLRLVSSGSQVHGFATHDDKYRIDNVLLWNFSKRTINVELTFENLPKEVLVRQLTLNAKAANNDENVRLRPEPVNRLSKGTHLLKAKFDPYGVKFWSC
jgi:hypothetical protein